MNKSVSVIALLFTFTLGCVTATTLVKPAEAGPSPKMLIANQGWSECVFYDAFATAAHVTKLEARAYSIPEGWQIAGMSGRQVLFCR